jgi:DNA repair protein RecO
MAYPIYTTPGFIVASYKTGEADKLLQIFTRDLGMVFAKAIGIRKLESKLRGHIQDYNVGLFSMVQGKSGWRLTSGDIFEENISQDLPQESTRSLARISNLLRRLYVGEEPNEVLFDVLISLLESPLIRDAEKLGVFELVTGVHIIEKLGYVSGDSILQEVVKMGTDIDTDFVIRHKRNIILDINRALKESHL